MIIQGQLVSPAGVTPGQVRFDGGTIAEVGSHLGNPDHAFNDDCLIFAGMGDIHIHARDDVSEVETYKEDFTTAAAAALHGGVVHVADMPNNPVAPIDDESYAEKQRHLEHRNVPIHVTLYAGIGPGTGPLSKPVPYKVYMGPSVGDLFFSSLKELETTIAQYRGQNVSFHCEDPILLEHHKSALTHEQRRPAECEISATKFALYLAEKYDLTAKLCHYSVKQGLPLIREAKADGLRVTAEVTPHHMYYDVLDITDENRGLMQMNPPLRNEADKLAMLEGLRDGTLDYLATDHAPHTIDEKVGQAFQPDRVSLAQSLRLEQSGQAGKPDLRSLSGQPHLDTYGPFVTWLLAEQQFSPQRIAEVCCANPGEFVNPYSAPKTFGRIEPGYVASLTVLNLKRPTTIRWEDLKTKCGWSPFEGVTFPGSVEAVFVEGRLVSGEG